MEGVGVDGTEGCNQRARQYPHEEVIEDAGEFGSNDSEKGRKVYMMLR